MSVRPSWRTQTKIDPNGSLGLASLVSQKNIAKKRSKKNNLDSLKGTSGARAHQTELETDTDMALDMDEHPEGASPTPQGSVGRFGQEDPPPRDPPADGRGDDHENNEDNIRATASAAASLDEKISKDQENKRNAEENKKKDQAKESNEDKGKNQKKENQDKNKQRNQEKKRPTINTNIFDTIFGKDDQTWTRFWNCFLDEDMGEINFRTYTKKEIGPNFTFHKNPDGTFVVDVKTRENSEKFENTERIGMAKLEKSRDFKRNSSQVTVLLTKNLKEEIQEMEAKGINVKGKLKEVLTEEGLLVETVDYYTRKSRRGRPTTLMILKITVNSLTPPEEVVLGSELLQCKKVREKPTQCRKCWKFGHPKKNCRGENMFYIHKKTII